jgi:hypothetical protein
MKYAESKQCPVCGIKFKPAIKRGKAQVCCSRLCDGNTRIWGVAGGVVSKGEDIGEGRRMKSGCETTKLVLSHVWKAGLLVRHPDWITCVTCGIIKRADGKNGPCRGAVKVVMRKAKERHE